MIRTRLDVVVQVKERDEEKAGVSLAKAESVVTTARLKLELARQAAANDTRTRSDISMWEMSELAHQRALTDAHKAQKELENAQKSAAQFRASYLNAHRTAEVVRRVADSRRDELSKEFTRAEDKQADEAASLSWFRKAS